MGVRSIHEGIALSMIYKMVQSHAANHRPLSRLLFLLAQTYVTAYCRIDDYNIDTNGERRFLNKLAKRGLGVVFDVGANVGAYSEAILEVAPSAQVHCFEISPATRQTLANRFRAFERVRIVEAGLLNESREVAVGHAVDDPTLTSLHDTAYATSLDEIRSSVLTGSEYMRTMNIDTIDLLKVDTEGHDLEVLQGFGSDINKVRVIQFEYNELSWARGNFIGKFVDALPSFSIGRLTYGGVIWDRSLIGNDRAFAGNMIAVDSTRSDLIAALEKF